MAKASCDVLEATEYLINEAKNEWLKGREKNQKNKEVSKEGCWFHSPDLGH